jgi:outer membrane protein TolC
MKRHHWYRGGSLLAVLFVLLAHRTGRAADPLDHILPTPPAAPPQVTKLTLPECVHLALERQPRLAASRASLAAAEDGKGALDALRLLATLDAEIPIRRKQAGLGVSAAVAGLDRAERDVVYAVTRTYFTVLYAREQERVAQSVVGRLSAIHDAARRQLEGGARDVTSVDVNRSAVYLRLAETKRTQATQGVKRALVALREAIGLDADVRLDVPVAHFPVSEVRPDRDEVVRSALARRGDMIQASIFAQVVCLEVDAQATSFQKRMETFAAGSDIHARSIPQEEHNSEYRPGAVPPEMPTLLAGSRVERMKRAQTLATRAAAVVDVTRNLITLEAEDAFLRWEEATQEARQAREAAETGDKLADDLNKDFTAGSKVKVEDVINFRVLAAQARSQYNEYLYRQILALADLERITAGGFCPRLVEPAVAWKPASPEAAGGK